MSRFTLNADEDDYAGTMEDDWSGSADLAAGLVHAFRSWRHPFPAHPDLGPNDFRNAAQRANNYRWAARWLNRWADMLDAGDPLEPGTPAYEAKP